MFLPRYSQVLALLGTVLLGVACGDSTGPAPVASIDVSPAASDVLIGATLKLAATPRDAPAVPSIARWHGPAAIRASLSWTRAGSSPA